MFAQLDLMTFIGHLTPTCYQMEKFFWALVTDPLDEIMRPFVKHVFSNLNPQRSQYVTI